MKKQILILIIPILIGLSCQKEPARTYPTEGLISRFDFNDNLKDQLGFWQEGLKTGNPVFVKGISGKAISFNGIDQGLVFNPVMPSFDNSFTVSFWFKETINKPAEFIFDFPDFDIGSDNNNERAYVTMSATGVSGKTKTNGWNHVACIYSGNDLHIYVNGLPGEKIKLVDVIGAYKSSFKVGYILSNYWAGAVDEVFLYNRALTEDEVIQLYRYHFNPLFFY